MKYTTCPRCGANNDHGERCDCETLHLVTPEPATSNKPEVKFMYNGIKVDGVLYKCTYCLNGRDHEYISVYAQSYKPLPKNIGLTIHNDTDSMSDYFDSDHARVYKTDPLYPLIYSAWLSAEVKTLTRDIKTIRKRFLDGRQRKYDGKNLAEYTDRLDALM